MRFLSLHAFAGCCLLALSPAAAQAEPLPPAVRAMIETALRNGNGGASAVIAVARQTNPGSEAEIDAIVGTIEQEQMRARERELARANLLANWRGSGEIGGSFATGNSDTVTLAIGIDLVREGLNWRHNFDALADLQRSEGVNSQERYAASYQADWKLSERAYLLGRLGWERNRAAGLQSRFGQTLGIGYHVIAAAPFSWRVEAGPSLRQSKYFDQTENTTALRVASDFSWQLTPDTRFAQSTAGTFETSNSSISSISSLTTKLWGPMSARLSFNLQYESDPPDDRRQLDTLSRVTLVYEFGAD